MNGHYTFRKMAVALVTLLLCGHASRAAQNIDYVTEEEEDLIRDAQGVQARINLYLKLLDNRIVALGLRERTAKEREQTKKDIADYQNEVKAAASSKIKDIEVRAKPVNPDIYLRDVTKAELLRGYMQIVDESMDYIDDAYDRHDDVRQSVETLQKFMEEQLPRFRKLETQTATEASALKATLTHSEQAIEDCRKALQSLPKTERSPAKSKG
jgi:predicted  nucleic acid-binding Zn-ribbon protein